MVRSQHRLSMFMPEGKTMRISVNLYQKIASQLLQTAFGLDLNDSRLSEEKVVALCIAHGVRPYQELNEHAREADLVRTDLPEVWGVPVAADLTAADEYKALATVNGIHALGEDVTHCPYCASRTDFEEWGPQQHHKCLNVACGQEFMAEGDTGGVDEDLEALRNSTSVTTSDGYRFTRQPDGSWTDGDMRHTNLEALYAACEGELQDTSNKVVPS